MNQEAVSFREDSSSVFTTYDLGASAALLSSGYQLQGLEKTNSRKVLFVFKRDKEIEEHANKYFSNQLEVKARSYFDNLKALKNKLYSD
ncbi:MAG: DUF5659 domain-containing protein [Candidatus Paceibacterota bacterium]